MIKTKKINSISYRQEQPNTNDTIYVNVLTWHGPGHPNGSNYHVFSPYFLKTDGCEQNHNVGGVLFENFWQGSKVWRRVYDIDVWAHPNLRGKKEHLWWSYKCGNGQGSEEHIDKADNIQPEYYAWREKIFNCPKPIRYPNERKRVGETVFSLLIDRDGKERRLGYIEARKVIYFEEYCRLIEQLPEFEQLLKLLNEKKNLIICEVDVPDNEIITLEKIKTLIDCPSIKFGHGLCLAYSLLKHHNETLAVV